MMIDYMLLGIVLHKAQTGYAIKKEIEMGIGNFYKVSYGQLYPALKKLTEKKWLEMEEKPQGARQKKFYLATKQGREEFLKWLSMPYDPAVSSDALLAKIFFYGELPQELRKQRLEEYERAVLSALQGLEAIEQQFAGQIHDDRDYFELSTLYLGLANAQTSLRWFRHLKEQKPLSAFLLEREKD